MEPKGKTLYDEMLEVLTENGKTFDDVLYVAVNEIMDRLTTQKAVEEAKRIFTDDEEHLARLADPIIMKGDGWIAERTAYREDFDASGNCWTFEAYEDPQEDIEDDPDVHLLMPAQVETRDEWINRLHGEHNG